MALSGAFIHKLFNAAWTDPFDGPNLVWVADKWGKVLRNLRPKTIK